MKKLAVLFLTAGLLFTGPEFAKAIDFKVKGEWLMTFTGGQASLLESSRQGNKRSTPTQEHFTAGQRVRLQLEAVASENLSATVQFQIGAQFWGKASQGAALGADGVAVKVRQAYIDWMWPDANLKNRMGIQFFMLPNKAGGPAILASRVGAVVSSFEAAENFSVTGFWARPFNDNYEGEKADDSIRHANYLDNLDLFGLVFNLKQDGFELSPWAMYGFRGRNALWNNGNDPSLTNFATAGNPVFTLFPYPAMMNRDGDYTNNSTSKAWGSMFWAGLPIGITAFDPWNIELDINYGYVEAMGRYNAYKGAMTPDNLKRSSTQRQGWLAKALVEYKLDWGVPGIYGWYASGDDGNPKNGSERIPSLCAYGNFTTFLGDTGYTLVPWHDSSLDYAGTWGIGLRLRDLSFIEDLTHTFRATWWGGTNSPKMAKYMSNAAAWNQGWQNWDGPYLTTQDGLLELNLVNKYQMYENLTVYCELGYIANFIDNDTWDKAGNRDSTFRKQDAWKAQLSFVYSF